MMTRSATNGNAPAPDVPEAPPWPPWRNVDPAAMVPQLAAQVAAQAEEMAAMRCYIDQLHQALALASAAEVPDTDHAAS